MTATESSPLYNHPLTEQDIAQIFGLKKGKSVTKAVFEAFLKSRVKIAAEDASQAAKAFLSVNSPSFIPDAEKRQALAAEGATQASVTDGLSPAEYLTYLRIAYGDGRCPGAKAGSQACPAYVKDFQMSLITIQNGIFNVRFTGADCQYDNKLTIHRESQANRQTFDFIGRALGLGGDSLRETVIDPNNPNHCSELESMLGTSSALERFMAQDMQINATVAAVTARQWGSVVQEVTEGVTYTYGIVPLLAGQVCSRDNLGQCYAADPQMALKIKSQIPNIETKTQFTCHEIASVINTLASMPALEPINFAQPLALPYDNGSPDLTADELFDFFIALGNGLTNRPDAPFADTLPLADFNLLLASGIPNAEYERTSRTHRYFLEPFIGR